MDNKIIAWVQIRKFVTRFMLFIAVVTLLCIGAANSGDTFAKSRKTSQHRRWENESNRHSNLHTR